MTVDSMTPRQRVTFLRANAQDLRVMAANTLSTRRFREYITAARQCEADADRTARLAGLR